MISFIYLISTKMSEMRALLKWLAPDTFKFWFLISVLDPTEGEGAGKEEGTSGLSDLW